jgi:transglutaminase-like putative cysteine protease
MAGAGRPRVEDTMHRVRVGCEFGYESDGPVPMLILAQVRPDDGHGIIYESRWTQPAVPIHEYADSFGNVCWRLTAPGGPLTIRYDAVVDIEGEPDPVLPELPLRPVQDLPDDTLTFTLPSRYVQSDLLMTAAWELFGATPPTWARVQAICDWVHNNITFQTGASTPTTTAVDTYEQRIGVCRDFALLAVAFCRAMNVPARYGFGYLPDIGVVPPDVPMDFHSWFEAFVGDRWYTFDARHNEPRIGRIFVGRGRDAVDVALTTSYGTTILTKFEVWADEVAADDPGGPSPEPDADALEAAERGQATTSLQGSGARPGF